MSCNTNLPANTPNDFAELLYPQVEGVLPQNYSVMAALAPCGVTVPALPTHLVPAHHNQAARVHSAAQPQGMHLMRRL